MTNQNFPIGSIDWLNAMRRDFNLNGAGALNHTSPTPTRSHDLAEIHSEIGEVSNQAAALRERAADLEARVSDLRERLSAAKNS
jgi:hypothetical protein